MQRDKYWRLTIEFWAHAVDAGVQPVKCHGFPTEDHPGHYRSHTVDFNEPPTREDFLAVVAMTPWMQSWKDSLIPVMEKNDWPMIDYMHKGSSVTLMRDGVEVGRLEVWRQHLYLNQPTVVPPVLCDEVDQAVRGLRRSVVEEARTLIRNSENKLRELFVKKRLWDSPEGRVLVMQELLYEAKIRTSKPKKRAA